MTDVNAPAGYVSYDDVQRMIKDALDQQETKHNEQLAEARSKLPRAMVPAHSGGPGVDNHQRSWSLADQEAALRGETLDHWESD